jgi:hypothetical protein
MAKTDDLIQVQEPNKISPVFKLIIGCQSEQATKFNLPAKLLKSAIKHHNTAVQKKPKADKNSLISGNFLSLNQLICLSQQNEDFAHDLLKVSISKLFLLHVEHFKFILAKDPASLSIFFDEEPTWQLNLTTQEFEHDIFKGSNEPNYNIFDKLNHTTQSAKYFLVYNVYASLIYHSLQAQPQLATHCLTDNNKKMLAFFLPEQRAPYESTTLLDTIANTYQALYGIKLLDQSRLSQFSFAEILDLCDASEDLQQKLFSEILARLKKSIEVGKKPEQQLDLATIKFAYPLEDTNVCYTLFSQLLFRYFKENKSQALAACLESPTLAKYVYQVTSNTLLNLVNPLANYALNQNPESIAKTVKKQSEQIFTKLLDQQPKLLTKVVQNPALFTRFYNKHAQISRLLLQISQAEAHSTETSDKLNPSARISDKMLSAIEAHRPYGFTYQILKFILDKTGFNLHKTKLSYYEAYLAIKDYQHNETVGGDQKKLSLTPVRKSQKNLSSPPNAGSPNMDEAIAFASSHNEPQESTERDILLVEEAPENDTSTTEDASEREVVKTFKPLFGKTRRRIILEDEPSSSEGLDSSSATSLDETMSTNCWSCSIL